MDKFKYKFDSYSIPFYRHSITWVDQGLFRKLKMLLLIY